MDKPIRELTLATTDNSQVVVENIIQNGKVIRSTTFTKEQLLSQKARIDELLAVFTS